MAKIPRDSLRFAPTGALIREPRARARYSILLPPARKPGRQRRWVTRISKFREWRSVVSIAAGQGWNSDCS